MSAQQTTNFAIIPEWVLYNASASAVKVYAVIDRHSNREGESFPGWQRIATLAGVSVATVKRAVADLEKMGALVRWRRGRKGGGRTSNGYRLIRDEPSTEGKQVIDDPIKEVTGDLGRNENQSEREEEEPNGSSSSVVELELLDLEKPPSAKRLAGRDLPFDALAAFSKARDRNALKAVGIGLNGGKGIVGIRQLAWDELTGEARRIYLNGQAEAWERYLADAIAERGARYCRVRPKWEQTPTALATWWGRLEGMGPREGGLTPAEIIAAGRSGNL